MYSFDATFPVVVRTRAQAIMARINPDRTWSIDWSEVINTAYGVQTADNLAVRAICTMLVAGRDNFRTLPLSDPHQPWDGLQFDIGYHTPHPTDNAVLALVGSTGLLAYINTNGVWSVDWQKVLETRLLPDSRVERSGIVPLAGFCEALYGAKDNFHTQPMEE